MAPPPASEILIRRIVRKRLRALQDQLVEAALGQKSAGRRGVVLAVTPRGRPPVPLLIEGTDLSGLDPAYPHAHLVETEAFLDMILPDAAIGQRRPSSLSPARRLTLAKLWTMLRGVEVLVHDKPALTRTDFLKFVATAWPKTRGRGAANPPFDDALILGAHEALIREDRKRQNCKTACAELADRLSVSPDTIRRALRRARTTAPPRPTPHRRAR